MNQNEKIEELESRLKNLINVVKKLAVGYKERKPDYGSMRLGPTVYNCDLSTPYQKALDISCESLIKELDEHCERKQKYNDIIVDKQTYQSVYDILSTHKNQNLAYIIGNIDSFGWDENANNLFWEISNNRENKNEIQIQYLISLLDEKI
jgi:hypothetical protein